MEQKPTQSEFTTELTEMKPVHQRYQQKVSPLQPESMTRLEEQILQRDIYHTSFRSRTASPQFKMNPLYEPREEDTTENDKSNPQLRNVENVSSALDVQNINPQIINLPESGYNSSADSLVDTLPQYLPLRLVPPSTPQMVVKTLESLPSVRRTESLRINRGKSYPRRPVMGGSLRIHKPFKGHSLDQLW